jgi:hypothetical protein
VQARNSFAVTYSDEVYKVYEILSKIRHKFIQNIILSVFFLYKKVYYIINIALKNQKCVINIVKCHLGGSSNYFTSNTCGAPAKFGGDWKSPLDFVMDDTENVMNIPLDCHCICKVYLNLPYEIRRK